MKYKKLLANLHAAQKWYDALPEREKLVILGQEEFTKEQLLQFNN